MQRNCDDMSWWRGYIRLAIGMNKFQTQHNGGNGAHREHIAHIYTESDHLCSKVGEFVHAALSHDRAAIVIATADHTLRILSHLEKLNCDWNARISNEQLICIDAEAGLAEFMSEGVLQRSKFDSLIVALLGDAQQRFQGVSAYGELVNLLWKQDNRSAARQLECWWNDVIDRFGISLLCGYQANIFDTGAQDGLHDICATHSHVLPLVDEVRLRHAVGAALKEVIPHVDQRSIVGELAARCRRSAQLSDSHAALSALHDLLPMVAEDVRMRARELFSRSDLL
jgi:hypothetical protein